MGKRKIFYKKAKAMKLIRTDDHQRTQSHSLSASIDEESVASFQNQRNVEDQGRKYGGKARQPPPPVLLKILFFFAQKNCAFKSILVTNPYERTCYAPPASRYWLSAPPCLRD